MPDPTETSTPQADATQPADMTPADTESAQPFDTAALPDDNPQPAAPPQPASLDDDDDEGDDLVDQQPQTLRQLVKNLQEAAVTLANELSRISTYQDELTLRMERLDARFPTGGEPPFVEWLETVARIYHLGRDEIAQASDPSSRFFDSAVNQEMLAFWVWWQDAWSARGGGGSAREVWHAAFAQFLEIRRQSWTKRRTNIDQATEEQEYPR